MSKKCCWLTENCDKNGNLLRYAAAGAFVLIYSETSTLCHTSNSSFEKQKKVLVFVCLSPFFYCCVAHFQSVFCVLCVSWKSWNFRRCCLVFVLCVCMLCESIMHVLDSASPGCIISLGGLRAKLHVGFCLNHKLFSFHMFAQYFADTAIASWSKHCTYLFITLKPAEGPINVLKFTLRSHVEHNNKLCAIVLREICYEW